MQLLLGGVLSGQISTLFTQFNVTSQWQNLFTQAQNIGTAAISVGIIALLVVAFMAIVAILAGRWMK